MQKTRVISGVKTLLLREGWALVLLEPDGQLDLPGGRVEEGENYLDCLRREIKEETGLEKVEITNPFVPWSFHKESGLLVRGFTFLCRYKNGSIVLSPEHYRFIWIPITQLYSMNIYWKYGLNGFKFDFIKHS